MYPCRHGLTACRRKLDVDCQPHTEICGPVASHPGGEGVGSGPVSSLFLHRLPRPQGAEPDDRARTRTALPDGEAISAHARPAGGGLRPLLAAIGCVGVNYFGLACLAK